MIKKEFYKFNGVYYLFLALIAGFLIYLGFYLRNFAAQNGNTALNLNFLYNKNFWFLILTH